MNWDVYLALSEARGEGGNVRLIYDGKDLEIMTTGNLHEHFKDLLGHFIGAVASWSDIDHVACGQTTWQSEDAERGLEADLSYYFDPEKIRAAAEALARESKDPADYPWPDLAVEIDISRPQVDRPSIYSALEGRRDLAAGHGRDAHHRATPAGRLLCPGRGEPVPPRPRR